MDAARRLAEQLVFVLIQPQHPGNVGATARAMKNMGLRRLIIVDPPPSFDLERARWMAPGARDVLDEMRIVATLDEALDGVHVAMASTARHRRHDQPVSEPAAVASAFFEDNRCWAVLFGREDTGLVADDVFRCAGVLRIVTDEHASLNLGQAVLLVAHHFFEAARTHGLDAEGRPVQGRKHGSTGAQERTGAKTRRAELGEVEPAIQELIHVLDRVGFTRKTDPTKIAVGLREGLQRAQLSVRQVHSIRGMVRRMNYALEHPEQDWQGSRRDHPPDS